MDAADSLEGLFTGEDDEDDDAAAHAGEIEESGLNAEDDEDEELVRNVDAAEEEVNEDLSCIDGNK